MTIARLHPINQTIESYSRNNLPIKIIDISTKQPYLGNFSYADESVVTSQGFKYVEYPCNENDIPQGKQFSEVKHLIDDKGNDVFYCDLVDITIAHTFFNWELAETKIAEAFRNKFYDYRIDKYIISRNLQLQDFSTFKSYLFGLKAQSIINDEDYERVKDVLLLQNINLDDYKIKF